MMNQKFLGCIAAVCLLVVAWTGESRAQTTISEDFTGAGTANQWYFKDGACLTAGTYTSLVQPNYIPSCSTIWGTYYSIQQPNQAAADAHLVGGSAGTTSGGVTTAPLDPLGSGALRFTNGYPYGLWEDGSIVSANTFNAGQGVQITFKTVAYRGDSGGYGKDGADGIAFLLMNGALTPGTSPYNGIGNVGGSLGYGCSNINGPVYDGLVGAYIGLGIDEYGNFLHGAQLYPGYTGTNVVNPSYLGYNAPAGDNGQLGYGFHPNRIGLRGAGNVSWNYLNTTYPAYYPAGILSNPALQQQAVRNTCITGSVLNYSTSAYTSCTVGNGPGSTSTSPTESNCPATVSSATLTAAGLPALLDYAPIQNAYVELPSSVQIANESAMARPTGITTAGVTNGNVFLYNLRITQNGLLSLSYSENGGASTSIIKNQSITATNGALPATLRFGFAGATGGSSNIHELLCFKAAPVDTSSSSSTTDQQQTGKLETSSQAYFAYYDPTNWTGRMTAYGLATSSTGVVTINSLANWDSQCVLTGVANLSTTTCPTTGLTTPASAQPVATGTTGSRVMLTWNHAGAGVPFEWPGSSGITTAEENTLDAGDATPINSNRLSYLRGARTNEINTSGVGLFRTRDGVLSDIIDSSPTWVGPPSSPYTLAFRDRLFAGDATPENTGPSYASFIAANQGRLNVVYVGANDGFLHGFRSGSEDVNGNVINNSTTPNDGAEVLAYMPGTVVNTIHNSTNGALDFANAQYGHNFFVDSTPGTGDLFYGDAWHTWLVGGLGAGGADIFALDITDSSTASFNEGNAANVVKGDWTPTTITCANTSAPNASACGNNLGNTYGTPLIRRFHNGMWGAIFGNGYGSTSGDAGIFVMTVDPNTAATTFYYLSTSTSTGSAASPNGIAYVTTADLDGDHITDYVYAGDLQGNVWRFDLTGCLPVAGTSGTCTSTGWTVSPGPLFKTQSGQPITTPVVLASATVVGANPVLLVSFGTGQQAQFTNTTSTTFAAATQSIYGVWDWNFSTWNAASASRYASLSTAQVAKATSLASPYTLTASNLLAQSYTAGSIAGTVETSNSTVTWAQCGTATPITCNGGVFGWYANLPGSQGSGSYEQVVSVPSVYQQAFIVNSTTPAVNNPLSCSNSTNTGNTYIVSVLSGGTFTPIPTGSTTPTKTSGFLTNSDVNTVGQNTNETGSLTVVNTGSSTYLVGQSVNPTPGQAPGQATQFKLPTNIQVNRVTWTQLR
jgi:type IV pilus assembly protein PilY1